jgi:hypothetical protein
LGLLTEIIENVMRFEIYTVFYRSCLVCAKQVVGVGLADERLPSADMRAFCQQKIRYIWKYWSHEIQR